MYYVPCIRYYILCIIFDSICVIPSLRKSTDIDPTETLTYNQISNFNLYASVVMWFVSLVRPLIPAIDTWAMDDACWIGERRSISSCSSSRSCRTSRSETLCVMSIFCIMCMLFMYCYNIWLMYYVYSCSMIYYVLCILYCVLVLCVMSHVLCFFCTM